MFVKKNQIYVVEISGKCILKSNTTQKIKSRSFYCPQAKLSPWPHHPLRKRQITHSPKLRGRAMETNYKIYYFKSTLKPITM